MKKLFPDQIDEETARRKPPIQFTRMVHAFSGKPRAHMLESHDERALILRWQDKGDPDAMETLLHAYNGWLRSITLRTCAGRGYSGDVEDAYGVAVLGFIESCNKFDFGRQARISTFSKYRVVGEIAAYINRSSYPVAVGTGSDERMVQRHRKMLLDLFRDETGRDWGATPQDTKTLTRLSGFSAGALQRGLGVAEITETPARTLDVADPDAGAPETGLVRQQAAALIVDELAAMKKVMKRRDYAILTRFFENGDEDSSVNVKIAQSYGITPERVGQIRREALAQIRDSLRRKGVCATRDLLG